MMEKSFDLRLGTPSAGWLPITVRVGERVYETAASGVLNDPLDELVDAAVALRHDDPRRASVRPWEEPAWKELRFTAARGDEDVVIELIDTDRRTLMSKAAEKREAVATSLASKLAIFEEGLPRTGAVDGWGVFPSVKLRQLIPDTERVYVPPWKEARGLERVIDAPRGDWREPCAAWRWRRGDRCQTSMLASICWKRNAGRTLRGCAPHVERSARTRPSGAVLSIVGRMGAAVHACTKE